VNRALRAATMGVLLLSPVALSACSAGQVTQTATQERDKTGSSAKVGDITVRAVELEHPLGDIYDAGDDAGLRMAIVNSSQQSDTLTDITGDGFAAAEITGAPAESTGSATGTAPATGTATPPATGTATPPATGTATGSEAPGEIEIPGNSTVFVGEDGVEVTLTDLAESLTTGQRVELVLTFANAGEITVMAPVANPDREKSRGETFDFHEGTSREGGENGQG
jgi:copper(I)-binding protein